MLKFINKKLALQWIILIGLLALSLHTVASKTILINDNGTFFLFKSFAQFFSRHIFLGKGIIIIVLLLQVILLQFFFINNDYVVKKSLLPACFYLSILLITKSLTIISPCFFTLLFFILLISVDYDVSITCIKNSALWVGMFIALATGFDVCGLILLIIAITALIINQFSKIKEIAILLFGFSLVYLFFFSYFFLTNHLSEWKWSFQEISVFGFFNSGITTPVFLLVSLLGLSVIYLYFIIRIRIISESKVIKHRNKVFTFIIWSILMFSCLFVTNLTYPQSLGYIIVPASIYMSILTQEKNPFYINELVTLATFLIFVLLWG